MAVIYANIDRLEQFQEYWESIPAPLEAAISDRDTQISHTRTALNSAIGEAEEIRNKAQKRLAQVQEEMESARRSPDGPSRALSQRLEQCERAYEQTRRQLEALEAQRERFFEVSARCTAQQDQALESMKKLSAKGSDWFSGYIELLQEAKYAIYEDAFSGSSSFIAPDGSYIGARQPTKEERADIQKKTGWTDNQLNKCQIRPDGSLWYKTTNCEQEMGHHKGVMFQRDTVIINGVRVEGVFPEFHSHFQPDASLPESIWSKSREVHFDWCRTQLRVAVENNPALAAQFTAAERKLIAEEKQLPGYTWHHHQQPGKMQLVRTKMIRKALHHVGHTGGYALWCASPET